jgi:hypothetical protein
VVWAAGRAGWYTLTPSRAYKDIFADMREAAQCWYFILDTCQGEAVAPTEVFKQFSIKFSIKPAKSEERIRKHGAFIFANMKENKEQIKWPTKPFYQYLRIKVVKIHNQDLDIHRPNHSQVAASSSSATSSVKPKPSKTEAPVAKPALSKPPATKPTASSSKLPSTLPIHPPKKRGRPPKDPDLFTPPQSTKLEVAAPSMQQGTRTRPRGPPPPIQAAPTKVDSYDAIKLRGKQTSDAALLWKYILKATENIKATQLTLNNASWEIHSQFEFASVDDAQNYLIYQSDSLLRYMAERRRSKEWKNAPIFKELQESEGLPPALIAKMARRKLATRKEGLEEALQKTPLYYPSSSDESIVAGHQVLSSLRPKGRKSKFYSGKTPTLGKRKLEDDDTSVRSKSSKRRAASSISATSRDVSPSSTTSQQQAANPSSKRPNVPRWRKPRLDEDEDSPIGLLFENSISTEPNAEGDVWHCPHFGCNETVFGASEDLGSELIGEHMEEHAANDEHVDVVMREMKQCNLPVRYVYDLNMQIDDNETNEC